MMHVQRRAKQRFNINLDKYDIESIVAMIQSGQSAPYRRVSKYKCWHRVPIKGKVLNVLYESKSKFLLTVIPPPKNDVFNYVVPE